MKSTGLGLFAFALPEARFAACRGVVRSRGDGAGAGKEGTAAEGRRAVQTRRFFLGSVVLEPHRLFLSLSVLLPNLWVSGISRLRSRIWVHVPVGFLLFKLSGRKQVSFLAVVEKGTCASSRLVVLQTKLLLCGGDGVDASKTTGGRQSISPTHLLRSVRIYIFRVFHGLSVDRKLTRGDCG